MREGGGGVRFIAGVHPLRLATVSVLLEHGGTGAAIPARPDGEIKGLFPEILAPQEMLVDNSRAAAAAAAAAAAYAGGGGRQHLLAGAVPASTAAAKAAEVGTSFPSLVRAVLDVRDAA